MFLVSLAAIKVLKRANSVRKSEYMFINPKTGNRYISIHKSFDKAVRELNLRTNGSELRFQDLRYVYAAWMHQRGVSWDQLRHLVGHKQRSTTDRYGSVSRQEMSELLELIPDLRTS